MGDYSITQLIVGVASFWTVAFVVTKVASILRPAWFSSHSSSSSYFQMHPGFFKFYTTRLNPIFAWFARSNRALMKIWFSLGALFGFVAMLGSVIGLMLNLYWSLSKPTAKEQLLTPILPGVNIPQSQLAYYFLALLIAGILHEFGHAIAAIIEGRGVRGFGVFVLVLYPGAMVDISDDISQLSPFRQLKIYCAGAWHNFVIAVLAFIIASCVSTFMFPLFTTNGPGVSVMYVAQESPLYGYLNPGDRIVQINHYRISSEADWKAAFVDMHSHDVSQRKYCAAPDVLSAATGSTDCCELDYNGGLQCWQNDEQGGKRFCLPASKIVTQHSQYCEVAADCNTSKQADGFSNGGSESYCLLPVVPPKHMIFNLFRLNATSLIFLSHPSSLYQTIKVSNLKPRWLVPRMLITLPIIVERAMTYLWSISAALALLNLAPVYYLDGEHALRAYIQMFLPDWPDSWRESLTQLVLRVVTSLFLVSIVVSLAILYM